MTYLFAFLAGFAGFSGSAVFLGRPTGATSRIFSTVSWGYIASFVIGLIPAFSMRFLTLSYDIPRIFAISLAVSPSIIFIIGNYTTKLEKIHKYVNFTIHNISKNIKKIKIISHLCEFSLDIFSHICDNYNIDY